MTFYSLKEMKEKIELVTFLSGFGFDSKYLNEFKLADLKIIKDTIL